MSLRRSVFMLWCSAAIISPHYFNHIAPYRCLALTLYYFIKALEYDCQWATIKPTYQENMAGCCHFSSWLLHCFRNWPILYRRLDQRALSSSYDQYGLNDVAWSRWWRTNQRDTALESSSWRRRLFGDHDKKAREFITVAHLDISRALPRFHFD